MIREFLKTQKINCGYKPFKLSIEFERYLAQYNAKDYVIAGSVCSSVFGYADKMPKDLDLVHTSAHYVQTGTRVDIIPMMEGIPKNLDLGLVEKDGRRYVHPLTNVYTTYKLKWNSNFSNNHLSDRIKVYLIELALNLKLKGEEWVISEFVSSPKLNIHQALDRFDHKEIINNIYYENKSLVSFNM